MEPYTDMATDKIEIFFKYFDMSLKIKLGIFSY